MKNMQKLFGCALALFLSTGCQQILGIQDAVNGSGTGDTEPSPIDPQPSPNLTLNLSQSDSNYLSNNQVSFELISDMPIQNINFGCDINHIAPEGDNANPTKIGCPDITISIEGENEEGATSFFLTFEGANIHSDLPGSYRLVNIEISSSNHGEIAELENNAQWNIEQDMPESVGGLGLDLVHIQNSFTSNNDPNLIFKLSSDVFPEIDFGGAQIRCEITEPVGSLDPSGRDCPLELEKIVSDTERHYKFPDGFNSIDGTYSISVEILWGADIGAPMRLESAPVNWNISGETGTQYPALSLELENGPGPYSSNNDIDMIFKLSSDDLDRLELQPQDISCELDAQGLFSFFTNGNCPIELISPNQGTERRFKFKLNQPSAEGDYSLTINISVPRSDGTTHIISSNAGEWKIEAASSPPTTSEPIFAFLASAVTGNFGAGKANVRTHVDQLCEETVNDFFQGSAIAVEPFEYRAVISIEDDDSIFLLDVPRNRPIYHLEPSLSLSDKVKDNYTNLIDSGPEIGFDVVNHAASSSTIYAPSEFIWTGSNSSGEHIETRACEILDSSTNELQPWSANAANGNRILTNSQGSLWLEKEDGFSNSCIQPAHIICLAWKD